ncbi:hypothetical protein C7S18_06470 [Ahniella affigens]|uniref:Glycosyltransferase RgtA/B/C/D-like domain-containing protein n=1 Tax=Ahniella affigens TaxID=2021234 RepID=A0A2P1PPU4_9GAMM|nr:glucosyltransferase domain-containing protein [Ahniella affigens]AVP96866.1 hypothetical protein C7S18_06470 [Ahniella affigens]
MDQAAGIQQDPRWYWRVFAGLVGLWFVLILLPIILADRPFNDDVVRQATGFYGWNANGRHLSNLLMRVLALGQSRLVDLSPLPQLMALPILAVGSLYWLQRIRIQSVGMAILVALPIGAQPFYLENLSYQFDAGFMALGCTAALFAASRFRRDAGGIAIAAVALLACFGLYQPAINVFLVAFLLVLVRARLDGEVMHVIVRDLLGAVALAGAIGMLHRTLTAHSVSAWVGEHSQLLPFHDLLSGLIANSSAFIGFAAASFHARTLLLWALFAALGAMPWWQFRRTQPSATSLYAAMFWLILPIAMLLASVGPMLLLRDPVILPRVLLATGMLIAGFLAVGAFAIERSAQTTSSVATALRRTWFAATGLFMLIATTHAYAYGNALQAQKQLEHRIVSSLRDDLWQLQQDAGITAVRLDGSMTQSATTQRIGQSFPFIGRMIWPYLHHSDDFSVAFLSQHLPESLRLVPRTETPGWSTTECPSVVVRRADYRIRIFEHTAIVELIADASWHCSHDGPAS